MSCEPVDLTRQFTVLYVCTGNVCRSPFAELLTRHLLGARLQQDAERFVTLSAGVMAAIGAAIDPFTRVQLEAWNIDGEQFAARRLDEQMIDRADLVLAMTAEHRSVVLDMAPRALPRVFVLRELARIGIRLDLAELPRLSPIDRAQAVVARARLSRPQARPRRATDDDITDPIGRPRRTHRKVARTIGAAVETIVDLIVPDGRPEAGSRQW